MSDTEKTVAWANWTLYLDYDDTTRTYPTLDAFIEQTGIDATYSEDIDGNDTYYGKVQGQLANGQDIGQDIVTLTDWMAARMIRLGYTQELDLANIPNSTNLLPSLKDVDFDPGRKHSLTWQSGFGGIAWNKEAVPGGLRTVSDLWKPELKGRVEVLDEWRDTIGLIMIEQGVDIGSDWGADEFGAAIAVLEEQINNGQIRQVKGNSYKEDLISGDALAVIGWSGDITQINFESDDQLGVRHPGQRRDPLERQHDGSDRRPPQEERRDADGLLLRPRPWPPRSPPTSTTSVPSRGRRRRWRRSTRSWLRTPASSRTTRRWRP